MKYLLPLLILLSCNTLKKNNTNSLQFVAEDVLLCSNPYQYSEEDPNLFKKRYYKFYTDGIYKTASFDTKIEGITKIDLEYDKIGKYKLDGEIITISFIDTVEVINLTEGSSSSQFEEYLTEYQILLVDTTPIFKFRRNALNFKGNFIWTEQSYQYCEN